MLVQERSGFMASYAGSTEYAEARTGDGWVVFAATMLGLAGVWNFIDGILAISRSHVFTANAHYVFSDLRTWGWIVMLLGIVLLLAAFAVVNGSEFARWFGIAAAGVNAIAQLSFVPAYPWWSLAMFTVDLLIIYALAVYGGKRLRST
jgi:hypothetical protein